MRRIVVSVALLLLLFSGPGRVKGSIVTFDDEAAFLSATGATEAADFHDTSTGDKGMSFTLGTLTFTSASGKLWVRDWSNRLDNEELAISDVENLDVSINFGGEVFSFGFEFVEPEYDWNLSGWGKYDYSYFVDSTFTVTLLSGSTYVDSFSFNAPNDQAAFVGVWSYPDQGFDKVEIRETVGGIGNEFFGEFYVGTEPIPEPVSILIWSLLSLVCVGAYRWRRSGSVEFGGSRPPSRQPARRPWPQGTTEAILEIIDRGRMR